MKELFDEPPSYPPDELTDEELFDEAGPELAKELPFIRSTGSKAKFCIYGDEGKE